MAVGRKFVDDRAGGFAALIAYYAFFSIFPLLLALTSVLGFVLQGDEQLQEEIVDSVFAELPVVGPEIRDSIGQIDGSGPALVIGLGLSLWAGLGVTLALSRALDRVWGVPRVRSGGATSRRERAGCCCSSRSVSRWSRRASPPASRSPGSSTRGSSQC